MKNLPQLLQNKSANIVACDIETNSLVNPDKIWCIVCKNLNTGEREVFRNVHASSDRFLQYADTVQLWIGHNFISYDSPILHRLVPNFRTNLYNEYSVLDTLVISRLLHYATKGGHSLETWGETLGFPKSKFKNFSEWSQELEDRCISDVDITEKVFLHFRDFLINPNWQRAIRTEHEISWILNKVKQNGFAFNLPKAKKLYQKISSRVEVLLNELQKDFPPKSKLIREITPKATKHGTISLTDFRWLAPHERDLSNYSVGARFSLFEYEIFNPKSTKQVVSRLNNLGWKPTVKTKTHIQIERDRDLSRLPYFKEYGWKINEHNLSTLPTDAPASAQRLSEYLLLTSRVSTLKEWLSSCTDGAIHGNIIHIGAWTHRMSHNSPNQANIPRIGTKYGKEFRSLWCSRNNRILVGTDADSIQLRILAHYINDPEFTKAVEFGNEDDETDIHSVNKQALNLPHLTRNHSKTFIYAFVLGVGISKAASILDCSLDEARFAIDSFLDAYPGLIELRKEKIPFDARRGYFDGFDGRKVICDSEHLMLAGYLQNGEAIIMKEANIIWDHQLVKEKIPFWQVNFVHDEWQTETVDNQKIAEYIGSVQEDSIKQTGLNLNLNVNLAGSATIGKNWKETH